LAARAERYLAAAHAARTREAYQRDWDAFEAWCARLGFLAWPAAPRTLELYLTHLAALGRKASTIRRARTAIGLAHGHAGLPRPDQHARIRALERGIGRVHGAREQGARPLLEHELAEVVRALGHSPREERDRALLLVGFAGAFRASELAGFNVDDVTFTPQGALLRVQRSKTDPLGKGQCTQVPYGAHADTCPGRALQAWLARVGRRSGPLFRRVQGNTVEPSRIHPRAVTRALQRAAARAGLPVHYSAHSLRVGLATSAYARGVSTREIQLQGRWQHPCSVERYIRLEHVPGRKNVAEGLL
jgi:site-specific recombinase XerD